ncbi:MAG: hypothetical protein U0U09_10120 [Cyclobacteriaceae bacterium]
MKITFSTLISNWFTICLLAMQTLSTMTTATLQHPNAAQASQAVQQVVQTAIKLKATTAAICGSALKRWSIAWSNQ